MTVFLTTHYMEEAAASDYVMVMDGGRIVAKGTPAQLKDAYAHDRLCLYGNSGRLAEVLQSAGHTFTKREGGIVVPLQTTMEALPLLGLCAPHYQNFEVQQGTMDDAFLGIVGEGLAQ